MSVTMSKWNKTVSLVALAVGLHLLPASVSPVAPAPAFAQDDEEGRKRRTKRTQALDTKVYESVGKAQEAYEIGDRQKAYDILNDLTSSDRLGDYERAYVNTVLASWAYEEDRPQDAIQYFEVVLQQEEAPETFLDQAIFNLAQIYFITEQYQKSIDYMNRYLQRAETPGLTPYNFLAQAHYQLEEYDRVIEYANFLIEKARELNQEIRESWYLLLRSSYFTLQNFEKVRDITEILVINFSKPEYWRSLAAIYGELGQEQKQLAALEVAYKQGYFDTEAQLVSIAQYYMYHNVPIKAAWALEKGLKDGVVEPTADNLELLGRAYLLAQEYDEAIDTLLKAAAKQDDGEIWLQAGQALAEKQKWEEAADALEKALASGEVDSPNNARMLLGQAYMQIYDFDNARETFRKVRGDEELRSQARRWIRYIDRERERVAYLDRWLGTNYLKND
ncbi:MAG: tetratricopeptide repeat protein [Rhodothalassiaceae bacterium]